MKLTTAATLAFSAALMIGCGGGGGGDAAAGPDPARGKKLYDRAVLGANSAEGCASCHKYDESGGAADKAPYTKGTAARAATRVPGMSAEEYIRESILSPDAYVVDGYEPGSMYSGWDTDIPEQDLNDIVAYLLTEL